MNWKWEEFSIDAQKTIMEKCIVSLREGTAYDLSALLNAFQVMDYRWKENESVKPHFSTLWISDGKFGNELSMG
jgi:hypothetical protein